MRTFLRTAGLFAIPLLVGFVLLEARLSLVPNAFTYKQQLLERRLDAVDVLVVGSSHEFEGVNTDVFDRPGFNLAMPSQSLSQSSELATRYLASLANVRYVLLGISYYSLPYRMASVGDPLLGFYMRAYHLFGDTRLRDRINPLRYLYIGIYGWAEVQTMMFEGFKGDRTNMIAATGYDRIGFEAPPDAGPTYYALHAKSRASVHREMARPANVAVNLAFIRRLAHECQRRHITLVLFTAPVTKEYHDAFGEPLWREWRTTIEQFANELGVHYTDYSRQTSFERSDFGDSDHLNPAGAVKFSRMLAADLPAPAKQAAGR